MKQGYIILGVDAAGSIQNIKAAYALSLSLKISDPLRETCVVVNNFLDVPAEYEEGFNYIVELPFKRTEASHNDIMIDWWQIYYCTPFEETIAIHNYSIALDNMEMLWHQTSDIDIAFADSCDFRSILCTDVERTHANVRNNIAVYNAKVVYFRKSQIASEFFKMADPVFRSWRESYYATLPEYRPADFDLDLMCGITVSMLGENYPKLKLFNYNDLKINFLFDPTIENPLNWQEQYTVWVTNNLQVKINNHRQRGLFHYGYPQFLTTDIMRKINDSYNTKTS
jgi:hypothetical protein